MRLGSFLDAVRLLVECRRRSLSWTAWLLMTVFEHFELTLLLRAAMAMAASKDFDLK
jgi:hypothetical protein